MMFSFDFLVLTIFLSYFREFLATLPIALPRQPIAVSNLYLFDRYQISHSDANPKNNWMRGEQACLALPHYLFFSLLINSKVWVIKSIIQSIIDHFVVGSSLQPCQQFFSTCSPEYPHLPCWLLIGDHHRCVCFFYLYLYLVSTLCCHTGKGSSGHIGMEPSE